MLPFQTERGTLQRYVFYIAIRLKETCLTDNDICLSDGRKM